MKIVFVVGARPNFVKVAPLIVELDKEKRKMYHMQKNNPFMMGEGDQGIDNLFKMFFGGGIPGMSPGMPGMVGGMPGMPHVQIFRNGRPINVNQVRKPSPIIKTISIISDYKLNKIKLYKNLYEISHFGNYDVFKKLLSMESIDINLINDKCEISFK